MKSSQGESPGLCRATAGNGGGRHCLQEKWYHVEGDPWRNEILRGEAGRFGFWVPAKGREMRRELSRNNCLGKGPWGKGWILKHPGY